MKQLFIKLTSLAFMLLPVTLFAQQVWQTEIQVYPKPTISIDTTTFCQGDEATLTLTGTAPFIVDFDDNLGSYTGPMTFGDTDFPLTAGTPDPVTGATTYTINIVAGEAGTFSVTDITITDANGCSNNIGNMTITVNQAPSILLTETEICQLDSATFEVAPSEATVNITSFTSTPSMGIPAPINGLRSGSKLQGGQAGNFVFSIPIGALEIVSTGCKNLVEITDSIIVHATPTVVITKEVVCQNDMVDVVFTGKQPFTVAWTSGNQAGLPTLYGTGGVSLTSNGPLSDNTGDSTYTAKVPAGSYGVFNWVGTLTDGNAPACKANVSEIITVNPAPTVSITTDPLCEEEELTITFTGSGTTGSFELCYGIQEATDIINDPTIYGDTINPSVIDLPDTFAPTLETPSTGAAGAVSTYTTTINPGKPGKFKFILKSITSPDGCKSVNPDASSVAGINWCSE